MSAAPSASELDAVAETLRRRTGLLLGPHRKADLRAATEAAMARASLTSAADFARRLDAGLLSDESLVAALTIGETYFFRTVEHFAYVRQVALPALAAQRPPGHVFRLWSAGCATGEEAYSLAMLMHAEGFAERATVLGTDISLPSLARARAARYRAWSLRERPSPASAYLREAEGNLEVDPSIARMVRFEFLNLAAQVYPSLATGTWGMDVIFCRNVLIYLDEATVAAIAGRLYAALADGGTLVTGPSDPSLARLAPFEVVMRPDGIYYGRPRGRAREAPPPPSVPLALPVALPPPTRSIVAPVVAPAAVVAPASVVAPAPAARASGTAVDPALEAAAAIRRVADRGGVDEARRQIAAALLEHPTSAELQFLAALLALEVNDAAAARLALDRVLYLAPTASIAHLTLAMVARRLGLADVARRALRNARGLAAARPPDEPARFGDGEVEGRVVRLVDAQLELMEAR